MRLANKVGEAFPLAPLLGRGTNKDTQLLKTENNAWLFLQGHFVGPGKSFGPSLRPRQLLLEAAWARPEKAHEGCLTLCAMKGPGDPMPKAVLGIPSAFFPRKPPLKPRENDWFLKRTMVEKNGESTPRAVGEIFALDHGLLDFPQN